MQPNDAPPPYTPQVCNPPTAPNIVATPKLFGPEPMQLTCTNCNQLITTTVVHELGSCSYIAVVTLFILFCPCFWIPFVCPGCKDVHHTCPACNALLGTYKII